MSDLFVVEEHEARAMFAACGLPEAKEGWTLAKLKNNLAHIKDIISDDVQVPEEYSQLLAGILSATEEGRAVEVIFGDAIVDAPGSPPVTNDAVDAAPPADTAETPKKGRKVKATKVKTAPSADNGKKLLKVPTKNGKTAPGVKVGHAKGYPILDKPSTAVIHWMARNKFDFAEAKKVLKHFKLAEEQDGISDINLRARLAKGRSDKGAPARLSKEEADTLRRIAGKA